MGLDLHRPSELKLKLHPNEKLRAWYASHTFGGTTKAKSLKILGFSKKNFYYVAAGLVVLLVIAGAGAGLAVKGGIGKAKAAGAAQEALGEMAVGQTTLSRVRTQVQDWQTRVTTDVGTVRTTFQKGAGTTGVVATGQDGKPTTLPANVLYETNSEGQKEKITKVGSTLLATQNGIAEVTTVFGEAYTTTKDGSVLVVTDFEGLTVVTGEGGVASTVIETAAATTMEGAGMSPTNTASAGATPTSPATTAAPTATPSSSTASSTSTSASSTSTAASGGEGGGGGEAPSNGGEEEFEGEATFYAPGLGSCGTEATDADYVAALSKVLFDATGATNSNNNPYCGRKAFIEAAGGGGSRRRWLDGVEVESNATTTKTVAAAAVGRLHDRHQRWSRRSVVAAPSRVVEMMMPPAGITEAPDPDRAALWERQAGGGGVTVTIVDRCPVCKQYDLDLSPAAYNILGDPDAGRIPIKWYWLD